MEKTPDAPQPQGNRRWLLIGAGCCGCLAVAVGAFALIFFVALKANAAAAARSRQFLECAGKGDSAGAYACFHSALKKEKDEAWLKEAIAGNPELFQLGDPTFNQQSRENDVVNLRGTALSRTTNVTIYVRFRLVAEGDTWGIVKFDLKKTPFDD